MDADPAFIVGPRDASEALAAALAQEGIKAAVLDNLSDVPKDARVVIALYGLFDVSSPKEAMEVSKQALLLASKLAPRFEAEGGSLVFVQDTGGDFGHSGDLQRAWIGGLTSLAKACLYEWPKAFIRAIDIERAGRDTQEVARQIAKELLRGGNDPEIGLRADGRRLALNPVPRPAEGGEPTVDSSSVIVATGGGRGITAACLTRLAKRVHPKIAILGRTELAEEPDWAEGISGDANLKRAFLTTMKAQGQNVTPIDAKKEASRIEAMREIRQTLEELKALDCEAEYITCDVGNQESLRVALERVRQRFGPVTALIHGAGVLADKRLRDKKPEHFDYVFGTKVLGLANLLEALQNDPLKAICLFSSIAGRSGNIGQSDYGMANEVLNLVALALSKQRPGVKVKAIGWGAWEGGMVTPILQKEFEKRGIHLIPKEEGVRAFLREMLQAKESEPEVVIAGDISIAKLVTFLNRPKECRFDILVGKETHPYLEGHKIQGKVVLPFVIALEWFMRAAKAFRPEKVVLGGKDIRLKKGVILKDFDMRLTRLSVTIVEVEPESLTASLLNEEGAVAYTAHIAMGDTRPTLEAPVFEPFLEKPNIKPEEIYGKVIFHQKPFDAIIEVEGIEEGRFGGRLKGVIEAGWPLEEDWQADPLTIDGGMQLAWLWALEKLGNAILPVAIKQISIAKWGAIREPIRCLVEAKKKGGGLGAVFNGWIVDEKGETMGEVSNLEAYSLPSSWRDALSS